MLKVWIAKCILGFLSCSNAVDYKKEDEELENIQEETRLALCVASRADPFKCVSQACHSVLGNYDKYENQCQCPDPKQIFSASNGGQCLPAEVFGAGELVQQVDYIQIPRMFWNWFSMPFLTGKETDFKQKALSNLMVKEVALFKKPMIESIERYYLEPKEEEWIYILQRKPNRIGSTLKFPQNPIIQKAWDLIFQGGSLKEQRIEFFTQDGCAGHCIIEKEYSWKESYRLLEIKEYVGGIAIRNQVILDQLKMPLYHAHTYFIEIDPSESPNLIYDVQIWIDPNLGDLLRSVSIYSRDGNRLDQSLNQVVIPDFQSELNLRVFSEQKNSLDSVVICDAGILSTSYVKTRLGPWPQKSFWGWIDTESSDENLAFWEQLSGVQYWIWHNQKYFHGMPIEQHGASVARISTQGTDLSVISMTVDQCFTHYNRWKNAVKSYSKVVNVSALFYYDFISCSNEPQFVRSIGDREEPFLWVVGAGNEYRKNISSMNSFSCPQALGPRDNLIVVTSISGDYADTGIEYADIAAEGFDEATKNQGTSYAAPRVARVAALLAKEFPRLSVAEIRLAILLGAKVPQNPLPVRSRGILDEAGAREVAKDLLELRTHELKK